MESFLGDINECLPTMNTERQWNNSQAVETEEESSMNEEPPMPQSPIASTSQQSFPPQHPRRRAKGSEYLINEASKQMKDTFNTLNSVLKDQRTVENECELFCKLLAKKLQGLPENERATFMYRIDAMFIDRLRNLSSPSPNFYVSHYIPQRSTSQSSYSEPLHNEMRIPNRPTSSQSSYSEPLHNEMRIAKRPCASYSEPAIPNKIVPNPDSNPIDNSQQIVSSHSSYSDPIRHTPKQQNSAGMPSHRPIIIPRNRIKSLKICPPVLHIPDPSHNPVDKVTILSDQVIVSPRNNNVSPTEIGYYSDVSPARDYFENFNYSQEGQE